MPRLAILLVLVGSAAAAPDKTVIGTVLATNQRVNDAIAHALPDPPAPEPEASDEDGPPLPEALLPREEDRKPEPYWIHGRLEGATAKLVIRYRLRPVGPSSWNAFELSLPDGGVVTGAVVAGDGGTRRLELEPTERADARFGAVADAKPGRRRGWAVEVLPGAEKWLGMTALVAASRATVLTIDLEVDAPTCFHRDQRMVAIAPAWRPSIERSLKVVADGCQPAPKESWEAEEHPARAWIAWREPTHEVGPQIATRAERLDLAHGSIAHLEVALGNQLAAVPADLHTVFVVDISRSVESRELVTEAAIIKSYLAHAPATQVQVVLYARKPRALFPGWTTASAASATIARELANLTEQNGSNVDAGLVEAARWLAPIEGTRRVVLFSDDRLGDRVNGLKPEVLRAVLPARTLVHVVGIDEAVDTFAWSGGPEPVHPTVERDDGSAFAQLALASEGFAAHGHTEDGRADALVLVRPITLEKVSIAGGAWQEGDAPQLARACPHERADREFRKLDLAEGDSCEWFGDGKGGLGAITLHGLLWNHPVERRIAPDPGEHLALARTLVGFQMRVDDSVAKEVSFAARAVDQAWSLIATWGGPDGYSDATSVSGVSGSYCGCDGPGGSGGGGFAGAPRISMLRSLDDQLAQAIATCHADARVTIDLEFTLHEIVDVVVAAPSAALRDCVTEAVWNAPVYLAKPVPHSTAHVVL